MNEAFEKILERLDDGVSLPKMNGMERRVGKSQTQGFGIGVLFAKEIVKEVSKEYKGGWVPCSEKLPELRHVVLVTVKYTGFMGMHGYWIKTGHMEAENDWCGDCAGGEVIAWKPLPEPYKERESE